MSQTEKKRIDQTAQKIYDYCAHENNDWVEFPESYYEVDIGVHEAFNLIMQYISENFTVDTEAWRDD